MLHSKSTYFYRWSSRTKNNHILNPSKLTYVVPGVCSLALVLVLSFAIFPTIDNTNPAYAESGIMPLAVDQDGHIALELIGVADQITEATADQVSYRTNQFNVKYSQTSQYVVQVNSMNGYGSSLFGKDNPQAEIKGVGTNKTPDQFEKNTWGYAIGNGVSGGKNLTYNTVPEYNTQASPLIVNISRDNITDAEQTDPYTLAFAAKIGSDSPADHYISKVYLSVVRTPGRVYTVTYNANKPSGAEGDVTGTPAEIKFVDTGKPDEVFKLSMDVLKLKKYKFMGWTTDQANSIFGKTDKAAAEKAVQYPAGSNIEFPSATDTTVTLYAVWLEGGFGITTMQEMTKSVCDNADIGATDRVEDSREPGKMYWIAKLKDGNCWMTQNLDFNIPADLKLYAATSNVASDVTLPSVTTVTNSTSNGVAAWPMNSGTSQNSGYNILAYYDPGMMLKTDPATTNNCSDANINKLNDSACTSKGWKDVTTGYTPKDTAPEGDTPSDTSATGNVINETDKTYDAHYLSGNYYSWALATANSAWNAIAGGTQAPSSICPRGWKLPTSSNQLSNTLAPGNLDSFDVSGSFAYLFRQYGLATSSTSGSMTANGYNVYDAPLYYLRSGAVFNTSGHGYIYNAGNEGRYWSSVVYNDGYAYGFYFQATNGFYPSDNQARYRGLTIRCVHDPSIAEAD